MAAPRIKRDTQTGNTIGNTTPSPHLPTQNLQTVSANHFTDCFKYSLLSFPPRQCIKLIAFNSKTEKSKTKKTFFGLKTDALL